MEYANVHVQARSLDKLAEEMDAAMARYASEGWRLAAVTRMGGDGWGGSSVVVTFERGA